MDSEPGVSESGSYITAELTLKPNALLKKLSLYWLGPFWLLPGMSADGELKGLYTKYDSRDRATQRCLGNLVGIWVLHVNPRSATLRATPRPDT